MQARTILNTKITEVVSKKKRCALLTWFKAPLKSFSLSCPWYLIPNRHSSSLSTQSQKFWSKSWTPKEYFKPIKMSGISFGHVSASKISSRYTRQCKIIRRSTIFNILLSWQERIDLQKIFKRWRKGLASTNSILLRKLINCQIRIRCSLADSNKSRRKSKRIVNFRRVTWMAKTEQRWTPIKMIYSRANKSTICGS